jgi:hypothetical protein
MRNLVFGLITLGSLGILLQKLPRLDMPDRLMAHEFLLVDKNDQLRGMLLADSARASLSLFDGDSKARLHLVVKSDGTSTILLAGDNGNTRIALDTRVTGEPAISLMNESGETVCMLLLMGGQPHLFDRAGHPVR